MAVYVMQFGLLQHARAGQPLDGATLLGERLCAWPDLSVPAAAARLLLASVGVLQWLLRLGCLRWKFSFEKDFTNMAKTYARQSSDICRFDCRLWNVDLEYTFVQRLNVSWM